MHCSTLSNLTTQITTSHTDKLFLNYTNYACTLTSSMAVLRYIFHSSCANRFTMTAEFLLFIKASVLPFSSGETSNTKLYHREQYNIH